MSTKNTGVFCSRENFCAIASREISHVRVPPYCVKPTSERMKGASVPCCCTPADPVWKSQWCRDRQDNTKHWESFWIPNSGDKSSYFERSFFIRERNSVDRKHLSSDYELLSRGYSHLVCWSTFYCILLFLLWNCCLFEDNGRDVCLEPFWVSTPQCFCGEPTNWGIFACTSFLLGSFGVRWNGTTETYVRRVRVSQQWPWHGSVVICGRRARRHSRVSLSRILNRKVREVRVHLGSDFFRVLINSVEGTRSQKKCGRDKQLKPPKFRRAGQGNCWLAAESHSHPEQVADSFLPTKAPNMKPQVHFEFLAHPSRVKQLLVEQ